MRMMKEALDKENLSPFLMIQALGFHVPEAENLKAGYHELPEYPFCKFYPIDLLAENSSVVGEFKDYRRTMYCFLSYKTWQFLFNSARACCVTL